MPVAVTCWADGIETLQIKYNLKSLEDLRVLSIQVLLSHTFDFALLLFLHWAWAGWGIYFTTREQNHPHNTVHCTDTDTLKFVMQHGITYSLVVDSVTAVPLLWTHAHHLAWFLEFSLQNDVEEWINTGGMFLWSFYSFISLRVLSCLLACKQNEVWRKSRGMQNNKINHM